MSESVRLRPEPRTVTPAPVELAELFDAADFRGVVDAAEGRDRASPQDHELFAESLAALELQRLVGLPALARSNDRVVNRILVLLHASQPYQSGGYAVRAQGIIATLSRRWDIVPVTRPGFPADIGKGEAPSVLRLRGGESSVEGISYAHLATPLYPRRHGEMRYMLASIRRYEDVMRRVKPAVVHLRSTYLVALPGLIAAKRLGIPTIYEVSGFWELVYAGRLDQSGMIGRRNRTEWLERLVAAQVDRAVTLTSRMRDILVERGTPASHVDVSPNAVDSDRFEDSSQESGRDANVAREFGLSPVLPTIGYIGSFVDYEGLDLLVEAFQILRDQNVHFQAILVGDGAEHRRVHELVAEAGLSNVILTGRLPHRDVSRIYGTVDICAFPRASTPATEAVSPLKPFEALASAKAIVVSRVSALKEIVEDGETGLVMREHTAQELARLLRRLIEDSALRKRLAERGRAWVRSERSWEKAVQPLDKWYRELAGI